MPIRCAALVVAAILAACAPADRGAPGSAEVASQFAYAWPIAPGCRQKLERNPNFGNNVRLRANGTKRPHLGVDIMPPANDLHVYAANKGVVVENTPARGSGWGNYVVIRHDDGLRTLYGHLATPSKLAFGQRVVKGTMVGTAGQTETWYVHVHLEVLKKTSGKDWTKGRLDPASLAGPLDGCRNSAAPAGRQADVRSWAMDLLPEDITNVTRAIQLALAPVFLLTGIAGLLNVMTNRLARIVDRARAIQKDPDADAFPGEESFALRLHRLERRRHFTSIAITACTIAALLLCTVVATLFLEAIFDVRLSWLIAALFTGSTLGLVVGLGFFLREVHLATQMRIRVPVTPPPRS